MNAKEFIKKFGWDAFLIAKQQGPIHRYRYTIIWSDEIGFSDEINERDKEWTFKSSEVLKYVNAYEMVELSKGIDESLHSPEIKQAIALVQEINQ